MQIDFLFPGKTKQVYCATGIEDFYGRLQHFVRADMRIIKEKKMASADPKSLEACNRHILKQVRDPSFLVMLDASGKQVGSENFAKLITQWETAGHKIVTFFVGGAFGIPQKILAEADYVLSLSRMTFAHDLARLVLMEQLYRAYTIKAGTDYHK